MSITEDDVRVAPRAAITHQGVVPLSHDHFLIQPTLEQEVSCFLTVCGMNESPRVD